jgi:hypothetical protein
MDTDRLNECVIKLTTIVEHQENTLSDHETRLRTVESANSRKWDKVISAVVTASITVGITILINLLFHIN